MFIVGGALLQILDTTNVIREKISPTLDIYSVSTGGAAKCPGALTLADFGGAINYR